MLVWTIGLVFGTTSPNPGGDLEGPPPSGGSFVACRRPPRIGREGLRRGCLDFATLREPGTPQGIQASELRDNDRAVTDEGRL
jgi:hypothetical protein